MSERLLTAAELAELLGVTAGTIVDWSEAGRLPGFRIGGGKVGRLRFRESEILATLEGWRFGPTVTSGNVPGRPEASLATANPGE